MLDQTVFERLKWKLQPLFGYLMEFFVRYWANHYMDQFEHFKFQDSCGNVVYVTISYYTECPSDFHDV